MKRVLASLLFFAFVATGSADVTYSFKSSTWSEKVKTPVVLTGTSFLKPPTSFRMEYGNGSNPLMSKDVYWMSKDGKSVYIINTKEKTWQLYDLASFMKSLNSVMDAMKQVIQITVVSPSVKQTRGTKDMDVAGMKAKHYILVSDYTLITKIAFITTKQTTHSVKDVWMADNFMAGISDINQFQKVTSGYPDLDKLVTAEMVKAPGVVVKSSTTTENKNEKNVVTKDYAEYEVTSVKKDVLAASLFQIPAGYVEKKKEAPATNSGASQKSPATDLDKSVNQLKGLFGK